MVTIPITDEVLAALNGPRKIKKSKPTQKVAKKPTTPEKVKDLVAASLSQGIPKNIQEILEEVMHRVNDTLRISQIENGPRNYLLHGAAIAQKMVSALPEEEQEKKKAQLWNNGGKGGLSRANNPVDSYERFVDLISAIPASSVREEHEYRGLDSSMVRVFTVKLPGSCTVMVNALYLEDVPLRYFNEGLVKLRKVGRGLFESYCEMPQVMASNKLFSNYHKITVKVKKDSGAFLGWTPGVHRHIGGAHILCEIGLA
jgi:hypothetical protein